MHSDAPSPLVNVPAVHGALTARQALPSFTLEYVEPAMHAAHWRSAMAEPNAERPWPTGHVAHAAQLSVASVVLVVALNVPDAHATHCRLFVAEAATAV